MALEADGEAGAQLALDAVDQAGEQSGGGEALPLGQAGRSGSRRSAAATAKRSRAAASSRRAASL